MHVGPALHTIPISQSIFQEPMFRLDRNTLIPASNGSHVSVAAAVYS